MNRYVITRDKFMSIKEKNKLLRCCKNGASADLSGQRKTWVNRYMLIHLALNSGLRVSEIAYLKIMDVRLSGKENYLIVHGKGGRKRDVYLDDEIVTHLKSYIEIKKKVWQEPIDALAPLFSGRAGNHYTTTALEISFKKAAEKAGLPKYYSIHSSRHTYATLLLAKSKNIRFVQKQLGHASIAMTSLYADVLPEMNQNLANAILK
ncbi:MAG: site-specific integrase [Deltaproteobacteria bacterium]|nr:site-specific integrase [Deltaproteobacteria bacterium]